jgi:hypothetical protein
MQKLVRRNPDSGGGATVNASQQETQQEAMMVNAGVLVPERIVPGEINEHTECFTCSRIFFGRYLEHCPRCNSRALQHYTAGELNLLARPGNVGLYLVPKSRTEPSYERG